MVGIVGGGQLARMLIEAAVRLDCRTRVLAREQRDPAVRIAADALIGDWQDPGTLTSFAATCDVVTFDHELVSPEVLRAAEAGGATLQPSASSMAAASDKAEQRRLAARVGMAVAPYRHVHTLAELTSARHELGPSVVAKAVRGGYDGRGVLVVRDPADLERITDDDLRAAGGMIVEPELPLELELATQVVRSRDGTRVAYPVVRTIQDDGICTSVTAPAAIDPEMAAEMTRAAGDLADALDHVGVLALECFVVEGRLLLNELAPRVHNSGHYTIEACTTSQFENHLRAVLGLPLGDPALRVPAAAMANVIATGDRVPDSRVIPSPPRTAVHRYGKHPRPGRKIGHVTTWSPDPEQARRVAEGHAALLAGIDDGEGRQGAA